MVSRSKQNARTQVEPVSSDAGAASESVTVDVGSLSAPGGELIDLSAQAAEIAAATPPVVMENSLENAVATAPADVSKEPAENTEPQMLKVASDGIMVQPRTLKLPKPIHFFFEPQPAKRDIDKGNDANHINSGPHQVDPNRPVSCAPVMPNLVLLRDTGNPYPMTQDETVVSNSRWDKYHKLSHAIWGILVDKADYVTAAEIVKDAVGVAGVGYKKDGKTISKDAEYAVVDTLRDLRTYGLVTSDKATRAFKKTKFKVVADPFSVEFVEKASVV